MHLIEDMPSQSALKIEDGEIIVNENRITLPVIVSPDKIEPFDINSIKVFFSNTDFSQYELVLFGIGKGIQTDIWSEYQKVCFLQNCGFEWLSLNDSVSTMQVLMEEKRNFIAILSESPLS